VAVVGVQEQQTRWHHIEMVVAVVVVVWVGKITYLLDLAIFTPW
jgi:hypothetical protein